MHQFTAKRRLSTVDALTALERQQLVEVAERLWGEELSAEAAFQYQDFGRRCVLWCIAQDGAPLFELWADGEPWQDGVLLHAGTAKLAPILLVRQRFTSLVQGFEEIAASLNSAPKRQAPSYLIREAREEDAEAIVALLTPIIAAGTYTVMEHITLAEQRDFMRGFPRRGVFLVALSQESGELIGLQSVEPMAPKTQQHIAEVSTFVSLSAQRARVGQALSQEMSTRARARGLRKLMATVRADNASALSFYQRQGFVIIGRAREHAQVKGAYLDEILLERLLTE